VPLNASLLAGIRVREEACRLQRRISGGGRGRGRSSSRQDFGIRRVRNVHFSLPGGASSSTLPPTGMTRRIVLFERENTTTRKLLLTRSRATIRVFAGSQHQFLFSYALSAKACRGKSNRHDATDGRGEREEGGGGGEARREMPRKSFPVESCVRLSNNFKGGTSFLRNDCTKLRRLRWK